MLIAAPLLLAIAGWSARSWRIARADRWRCVVLGVCMAGFQVSYFNAVTLTGIAIAALIAICWRSPADHGAGGRPARRAVTARVGVALALGVTGTALLIVGPRTTADLSPRFVTGVLLALTASLGYALYVVLAKATLARIAPLPAAGATFTVAALVLAPMLLTAAWAGSSHSAGPGSLSRCGHHRRRLRDLLARPARRLGLGRRRRLAHRAAHRHAAGRLRLRRATGRRRRVRRRTPVRGADPPAEPGTRHRRGHRRGSGEGTSQVPLEQMRAMKARIVIPTFDERETIGSLIVALRRWLPGRHRAAHRGRRLPRRNGSAGARPHADRRAPGADRAAGQAGAGDGVSDGVPSRPGRGRRRLHRDDGRRLLARSGRRPRADRRGARTTIWSWARATPRGAPSPTGIPAGAC